MILEKRCPNCRIVKSQREFGFKKDTTDGLQNFCRVCMKQISYMSFVKKKLPNCHAFRDHVYANGANFYAFLYMYQMKDIYDKGNHISRRRRGYLTRIRYKYREFLGGK